MQAEFEDLKRLRRVVLRCQVSLCAHLSVLWLQRVRRLFVDLFDRLVFVTQLAQVYVQSFDLRPVLRTHKHAVMSRTDYVLNVLTAKVIVQRGRIDGVFIKNEHLFQSLTEYLSNQLILPGVILAILTDQEEIGFPDQIRSQHESKPYLDPYFLWLGFHLRHWSRFLLTLRVFRTGPNNMDQLISFFEELSDQVTEGVELGKTVLSCGFENDLVAKFVGHVWLENQVVQIWYRLLDLIVLSE